MSQLVIGMADYEATRFACRHWHYARSLPTGKLVRYGVWENDEFQGVVIFGRGSNRNLLRPYGLDVTQGCELVRVALRGHEAPVSQIVAQCLALLRRTQDGLRLVLSFADPDQGHRGAVYQAGNWLYLGPSRAQSAIVVNGETVHKKSATKRWGTARPEVLSELLGVPVEWGAPLWRHTYAMPMDRAMRRQLAPLAQEYPTAARPPGSVGVAD